MFRKELIEDDRVIRGKVLVVEARDFPLRFRKVLKAHDKLECGIQMMIFTNGIETTAHLIDFGWGTKVYPNHEILKAEIRRANRYSPFRNG